MRRLVRNVKVGNTWYGPAYDNANDVPAEVAEQIVNPAAWEGDLTSPAGDDEDREVQALRSEYEQLTGEKASKRWGLPRLQDEVDKARQSGEG